MEDKFNKSEEEIKEELSPEAYEVLRHKGTEAAFSGTFGTNTVKGYISAPFAEQSFSLQRQSLIPARAGLVFLTQLIWNTLNLWKMAVMA